MQKYAKLYKRIHTNNHNHNKQTTIYKKNKDKQKYTQTIHKKNMHKNTNICKHIQTYAKIYKKSAKLYKYVHKQMKININKQIYKKKYTNIYILKKQQK